MAVYYKFKSARDYDSIPMDGPFISVGVLKERIFESKHLGRGTDFDLVVTNAQSNEEYLDEAMLIPKNTSVLIRRVPGRPRMPIVTEQEPSVEKKVEDTTPEKSGYTGPDSMATKYTDETEWDEFGNDLYSIPDALPVVSANPLPEAPPANKADEDSKIKALIETPALDWQRQGTDGFGPGRGFGRGMGGRMGGRGFGLERKTPPPGYVCHRCKVSGHYIQHCPTNGDPNYDIKRVKPPTGIPKSMLMQTTDGSYALPSGAVAVLKPNEAAFEKEMEGLPSNRTVGDLPPELHCPLCKEVMKDAVLTSKCCFRSFCDKCIRDHIISKAKCVCDEKNVLADDLLPNKTLRDTIDRILESGNSSAENAGSTFQAQDMESARCSQPKIPSPTTSAASRGEHKPPLAKEEMPEADIIHRNSTKNVAEPVRIPSLVQERAKTGRMADVSEATHESMSFKEPAASQGSAPLAEEEVQQKLAPGDAAKKKKKKKVRVPPNDMWKAPHDMAAENFMMPMGQPVFNPYWNGFQPGMEGYMAPFAAPMPMMGYGLGPFDLPFPGAFPPDPFAGQGFMMPGMPPQRDLAELGMGMNAGPPAMSREEFEARKADVKRRREIERRADREFPRDREFGREVNSSGDISSMKSRPGPQSSSGTHRPHRPERPSPERPPRDIDLPPSPPPRPSKRKPDHGGDRDGDREYHDRPRERDRDHDRERERERERDRDRHRDHHSHHRSESSAPPPPAVSTTTSSSAAADKKHKASVFSRISFISGGGGGEAASKKRKAEGVGSGSHHKGSSSSSLAPGGGNGYYHEESKKPSMGSKKARSKEYESSDEEDRHFKRKPSRYEQSPPPAGEEEMWDGAGEGDLKRHRGSSRDRKHR